MKLEQLEQLSELTNDIGMLDALIDETEENISYILNQLKGIIGFSSDLVVEELLKNRSYGEIRDLILKLKCLNHLTARYNFLKDANILNLRNYEEHMNLINIYLEYYDKSRDADNSQLNYIIFTDAMLKNRTADNQIDIIRRYFNKFDLPYVHSLLDNNDILEKRTYEDQILLVDKAIKINSLETMDISLLQLFNSPGILANRTIDEQLKLIDCYLKYGSLTESDLDFLELFVNAGILEKRTCDQQIKLIEKYIEKKRNKKAYTILLDVDKMSFEEQCSELGRLFETDIQERIESIKNLKKLVEQLKENDIELFDRNTKLMVKEPIKKSAYEAMMKRKEV